MQQNWKIKTWLMAFLLFSMTVFGGCGGETVPVEPSGEMQQATLAEDGSYTMPEEVALYLHIYEKLPGNFITKKEASALGWDNKKGNLWDVAEGKSIGGDRFGNYEGLLPEEDGLEYRECDVNYTGGYRGSERIIYSNQGDIYYTADHYETFEELY